MIKIFDSQGKVRPISAIKNPLKENKKNLKKSKYNSKKDDAKSISSNLDLLNPMVIPLLTIQSQKNPNNDFINKSIDVILNNPSKLTEKWIYSLNSWANTMIKAMSLDPPDITEGDRYSIGPVVIVKISEASINDAYGTPSIIAVDDNGWRYYFKTSKAFSFKKGDSLQFKAKVSKHGDGITFLSRPSSIRLSECTDVDSSSCKVDNSKPNVCAINIFGEIND